MAANYVAYLETSHDPNPTQAALAQLAAALGTTTGVIAGAGLEQPPGQRPPGTQPALEVLSAGESRGYLGAGGVGRFLFVEPRGPVAIPVNYRMLGDDIVFRTSTRASAPAGTARWRASFEVDHIDEALSEGWSVLVSGDAYVVTGPAELAEVRSLGITPWAGGERDAFIRIVARDISGRRIRVTG
jgi:nitroimidazol reductase NimA-like FMN-containing flavoprotein (pyridoxamine 5'-phosphate oxidase superfamily)